MRKVLRGSEILLRHELEGSQECIRDALLEEGLVPLGFDSVR